LEIGIERYAKELVAKVAANGRCEFISEIAQIYSVAIFMRMAKVPMEDRSLLLGYSDTYFRSPDMASRARARADLADYNKRLIANRHDDRDGEDLISTVLNATLPDRKLNDLEQLGMVSSIFLGSLDTVVAMLSFLMHFLGKNPEIYAALTANPSRLDKPLEELIRMHGINNTRRGVTHDFEFKGIPLKTEDRILLLRPIIGFDDRKNPDPYRVDLERSNPTHLTFGHGAHFCIGTHLARTEIKYFLREWMSSIPAFTVEKSNMIGGHVWMPERLHLSWT
jgi:cytochrome P450